MRHCSKYILSQDKPLNLRMMCRNLWKHRHGLSLEFRRYRRTHCVCLASHSGSMSLYHTRCKGLASAYIATNSLCRNASPLQQEYRIQNQPESSLRILHLPHQDNRPRSLLDSSLRLLHHPRLDHQLRSLLDSSLELLHHPRQDHQLRSLLDSSRRLVQHPRQDHELQISFGSSLKPFQDPRQEYHLQSPAQSTLMLWFGGPNDSLLGMPDRFLLDTSVTSAVLHICTKARPDHKGAK